MDGSARVQVVTKDNPSILRKILENYYERTGIPMVLNTSLNVKGKPIVNDTVQADEFKRLTGVHVF